MYSESIFFPCCVIEMFPPLLFRKKKIHVGNSLNFLRLEGPTKRRHWLLLAAIKHWNMCKRSSGYGIMLLAPEQRHEWFEGLMRPSTPHRVIACDLHHKRLLNFHFWKCISLNDNLTASQMGEVGVTLFHVCIFHPWWDLIPYYYIYKPFINTHQIAFFSGPHNPWIIFIYNMSSAKLEERFANEHIYISPISETLRRYCSEICCRFEMPVGT